MLRDKNLIPLSHHHHHALALCVQIERAERTTAGEVRSWQEEIERAVRNEISYHFEAEERFLFPLAAEFREIAPLVEELRREHVALREWFRQAQSRELDSAGLVQFARALHDHVRKEERQLFEMCQQRFTREQLDRVGAQMDEYFRTSGMPGHACAVPMPRKPEQG